MNDNESGRSGDPNPPISSSIGNQPQDTLLMRGAFDAPATPGTLGRLERFEILRLLGEGGMGQVYLAREPVTGVQVALKIMKPQFADDPQLVHRFLIEARHMYGMSHPHILRVMEVSDRKEGPYYVMPYVDGGSLLTLCKPGEALPEQQLLPIAQQVAGALAYAHTRGIIHRDLKPNNVLLDKAGNAFLSDFGLVRTVFNDSMVDATASHLEGTAPYMSPAVAQGDAEDTRCDIYAFGAVLYQLLTGQQPYTGRTPQIILDQVLKGPPAPIREVNPKANPALVQIAEGCMAREVRDRYASMADVAADLNRAAKGEAALGPHGQMRLGKRINLRRLAIAVTVPLACAILAIGLWQVAARWSRSDSSVSGWRATLEKAANAYDENRFEEAIGLFDAALAAMNADQGTDPSVRKFSQDKARKGQFSARFILDRGKFPLPEQIELTQQKLTELNTNYTGQGTFTATKEGQIIADLANAGITDLAPLKGLPLTELDLYGNSIADLSPLRGMKLEVLNLRQTAVADLAPLKGQPLKSLDICETKVVDLGPLKGMTSLTNLWCAKTGIRDIGPLKGMTLKHLNLYFTGVSDLAPLQGMPLECLKLAYTPVSDLRPLKGMPLVELHVYRTSVTDLSPLRTLKALAVVDWIDPKPLLTDLYTALRTNGLAQAKQEAASLIADCRSVPAFSNVVAEAREIQTALVQFARGDTGDTGPYSQYWLKHLKERGIEPAWWAPLRCDTNGLITLYMRGGLVSSNVTLDALHYAPLRFLYFQERNVTNLQALAGLPLTELYLAGNPVSDLSPLRGMKLEHLDLSWTPVADLEPLKGMPLKLLNIRVTKVVDLSPIKGMTSLTNLDCVRTGIEDVGPLQGMPLKCLDIGDCPNVTDISPLQGMPLESLSIGRTPVSDLRPLKGLPLNYLNICECPNVTNISPLRGMPLEKLYLKTTPVADLAPLKGMPLNSLDLSGSKVVDLGPLKGMNSLTELNCNFTGVRDVTPLQGIPLKSLELGAEI